MVGLILPISLKLPSGFRSSAAPYVGPGDIVPGATSWPGLRSYSAAAIGGNAVRLVRQSDLVEQDFITLPNGALDVTSILAFRGASTVLVKTLYDQTGNGNHFTQSNNSTRMELVLGGAGGSLPCMLQTAGFNVPNLVLAALALSQPFTVAGVVNRVTGGGGEDIWFYVPTPEIRFSWLPSGAMRLLTNNGGQVLAASNTVADGTLNVGIGVYDGASSVIRVNGTETTGGSVIATAISGAVQLGLNPGKYCEFGVWPSGLSPANRAALKANMATYWGTP